MADTQKKYLSLEGLVEYDELIKAEIASSVSDKANVSHTHDSRYYTEAEVDTKLAGKANSSHTHSIANITNLQSSLDSKATAVDFDTHVSDTDVHITTTERTNWNKAKTHADSAHAPSNAEKNQNAFSYVKVGETSVAADTTTDTLTLVAGANVTITPDATNDKITISATDTNTTYSAGAGIALSGTTFSNAGVRGISTGTTKGAISVNTNGTTTSVPVYGLGSAAYTNSSAYDAAGAANTALANAKAYADSVGSTIKNDLLNGAGAAYDTLKELGDLIDTNTDAIDALETVAAGKADKAHTHTIANVSGLQAALDSKAAASHGTHVSYSTNAPKMDGSASAGEAATVSRSDHIHPTDTSRASKVEFDTHASDTTKHITSTERTNWNAAKTHADSAHAPSNAEKNQNAFSYVKVGETSVAADSATDTLTLVGSDITITPDATNDKITFGVASASTSTKGIVQLTNSTSSTSTTTAATPSSVKSAYDLANAAKSAAATAQATADGKAPASHTHTVANITDLTATAKELNYMDGVTSNVQTQLDGKASSGHSHSAATTSANGLMSASDKSKLDGIASGANKTIVDSSLSTSSTNPIRNSTVTTAINSANSAINANTNAISANTASINTLKTSLNSIVDITSAEIQALFSA